MIWIFISIGGLVGGYVPTLIGSGAFSVWSILGSMLGSIFGIFIYVKYVKD